MDIPNPHGRVPSMHCSIIHNEAPVDFGEFSRKRFWQVLVGNREYRIVTRTNVILRQLSFPLQIDKLCGKLAAILLSFVPF